MRVFSTVLLCALALPALIAGRKIKFTNHCNEPIWVSPLTNAEGPQLGVGIAKLVKEGSHTYQIPDSGWGGRFWPKMGCNANGQACDVGQSMPPCKPAGCDPPAETKVEFFFPPLGNGQDVWYDISLVDGYSISAAIIPSKIQGTCTRTRCAMSLANCPTEREVGDLRVIVGGKTVQCLSPCKKWNYPPPFGLGRPETQGNGQWYCCPTPPITPQQCRNNLVVNTEYVKLVHRDCPTAYSYSYDDEAGLHNCPNNVDFEVNFCIS
ncbi:unnamed protein product [Orchesella dallaii]|uniref:Thaumatin-like protein n=1 Tax=Orchesella dallaii TaxID=48710 RepID=A0ABP1RIK0_9HEXA